MRNVKMVVSYSGVNYFGFQKQPNLPTVQSVLEDRLATLYGEEVRIIGSGRTDAGVHAIGQVVNFLAPNDRYSLEELREILNEILPEDIWVREVEEVDFDFHARFSAKRRYYLYKLYCGGERDVFRRHTHWVLYKKPDVGLMKDSSEVFLGRKSFYAFCGGGIPYSQSFAQIREIEFEDKGDEVLIYVEGPFFLPRMVRMIVAALVRFGYGKDVAEEVKKRYLDGKVYEKYPYVASPYGLYLFRVEY